MRGTTQGHRINRRLRTVVPLVAIGGIAVGLAGCTDPSPGWDGVWDFSTGTAAELPQIDGETVEGPDVDPETVREIGSAGSATVFASRSGDLLCLTVFATEAQIAGTSCADAEPFDRRGLVAEVRGSGEGADLALYAVPLGFDLTEMDEWPGVTALTEQVAVQDLAQTRAADWDAPESVVLSGPRAQEIELTVARG
ncbi:hypothetical protein [Ruania halotolerans]|uniref:hypothetical protein n=1 Tax=Ruania halotolerans TaxID=2897773 RepID=UPI001E5F0614|nr:hypothetical protein [Ruania halotolerans]UFU07728.1 hypothetical protein LQF10_06415 [Ruania halotolerans]